MCLADIKGEIMLGEFVRLLGVGGDRALSDSELAQKKGEQFRDKMFEQAKRLGEIRGLVYSRDKLQEENDALKEEIKKLKEDNGWI